jgi:CTP-dependent riboflavin kinase
MEEATVELLTKIITQRVQYVYIMGLTHGALISGLFSGLLYLFLKKYKQHCNEN